MFLHLMDSIRLSLIGSLHEIKLQGMGEPLMNMNFFSMVELASSKGILVSTLNHSEEIGSKGEMANDARGHGLLAM